MKSINEMVNAILEALYRFTKLATSPNQALFKNSFLETPLRKIELWQIIVLC
jgi:hypothetical protein